MQRAVLPGDEGWRSGEHRCVSALAFRERETSHTFIVIRNSTDEVMIREGKGFSLNTTLFSINRNAVLHRDEEDVPVWLSATLPALSRTHNTVFLRCPSEDYCMVQLETSEHVCASLQSALAAIAY
jgi:hypothetical protein